MISKYALAAASAALLLMFFAAAPAMAAPADDACSLLTAGQISSEVGVPVGKGEYVTPTYKKTCTWTHAGGGNGLKFVTLSFQPGASFASTKAMAMQMNAMSKGKMISAPASGIGEDAFYTTMPGNYTALLVKKGSAAFKLAIYGAVPNAKAEAIEKDLASKVLPKL